jgi:hypothetical protein
MVSSQADMSKRREHAAITSMEALEIPYLWLSDETEGPQGMRCIAHGGEAPSLQGTR